MDGLHDQVIVTSGSLAAPSVSRPFKYNLEFLLRFNTVFIADDVPQIASTMAILAGNSILGTFYRAASCRALKYVRNLTVIELYETSLPTG